MIKPQDPISPSQTVTEARLALLGLADSTRAIEQGLALLRIAGGLGDLGGSRRVVGVEEIPAGPFCLDTEILLLVGDGAADGTPLPVIVSTTGLSAAPAPVIERPRGATLTLTGSGLHAISLSRSW